MKSIKMFGKSVPLLAIVVISLLAIGASAGLLGYYGRLSMTADIVQSVKMDGQGWDYPFEDDLGSPGAGTYIVRPHNIVNNADVDADIELDVDPGDDITVMFMNTLVLTSKDSSWNPTPAMKATITYTVVAPSFYYDIKAHGLESSTEYKLIYYQDGQDRFVDWGGDPGYLLGTFTSTFAGNINTNGIAVADPGDMPFDEDWNDCFEADYTQSPDNYDHMRGAKLWLVPSDCVSTESPIEVDVWAPTRFLFETDLIRYFENGDNTITIPHGQHLRFDFVYFTEVGYIPGPASATIELQLP